MSDLTYCAPNATKSLLLSAAPAPLTPTQVSNLTDWITALRSPDYRQTDGYLRAGDAFCCLGVMCDRYAKTHPTCRWDDVERFLFADADFDRMPPPFILTEFGLPSNADTELSEVNDSGEYLFSHIADALSQWLALQPRA